MKALVEHWSLSQVRAEVLPPGSKLKRLARMAQTISLVLLLSAMSSCSGSEKDNASTCEGNCVRLTGSVTDDTGAPVSGATASVQLGTAVYSGTTDGQGQYSLEFPKDNLPAFLSGHVSKPGFLPRAIPLAFQDGILYTLTPNSNVQTLATTAEDVVFSKGIAVTHLGDDNFEGTTNSQFQTFSQGELWSDSFTLSPQQRTTATTLTVTLRAKGIECDSVQTNIFAVDPSGQTIAPNPNQPLGASPSDGSFGFITKTFSLAGIPAGDITLSIRSRPSDSSTRTLVPGSPCSVGDRDDFEFLEVLGRLS